MKVYYESVRAWLLEKGKREMVYLTLVVRRNLFNCKKGTMLIKKEDEEKFKADPLAYIRESISKEKEILMNLTKEVEEWERIGGREVDCARQLREMYVRSQNIEFMEYWEQSYTKQLKLEL